MKESLKSKLQDQYLDVKNKELSTAKLALLVLLSRDKTADVFPNYFGVMGRIIRFNDVIMSLLLLKFIITDYSVK